MKGVNESVFWNSRAMLINFSTRRKLVYFTKLYRF